ncbi:glycoside hydrolase, family 3, N-terminal domain protein [Treponema socranskii subsp. socranskii VPI DR56BR1116 = ATCC 35536]|uniref:beta-N-acetylhexosaminidase n=1 Tax=Treponema socranskii subsp. socranskii VPI DR56BR1116 = ATCC 35536 TaxID=1125725 RepID=U1GSI8_TRESO|nr:glycoside hydrolase family 3 N-terminal domain-containing protein [Treponema socranskii]ERF60930.1 glycoside hydrolase, family 3, N-terminal domain protein [Treponema socranskii subsp. socranskii VPI DR56BR1116 = ATCC 35536]ERK00144.1 glycoside hydrolase, family 3, N-terminal domain protein [Treponema socranskii subsp. socranskii VPI DR56BR1116 = ATCC 35536]
MRSVRNGVAFFLITAFVFVSCSVSERRQMRRDGLMRDGARTVHEDVAAVLTAKREAVFSYVESLTIEEQVAQLFMENLVGDDVFTPVEWTDSSRSKALMPGGYIFFSYNIADTPEKIINFTDSIFSYCALHDCIPPYLALDQEGGDVCRLKAVSGKLPANGVVSEFFSISDAYRLYSLQALQMRLLGFTVNIAPVVEVRTESNEAFIGERSFGDADSVVAYGIAALNALQNNGVAAVIKHFPGNTNTDPHTGLPEIDISESEFNKTVRYPFFRLISLGSAGVLMSHARISLADSHTPACLSHVWIGDKLRGDLGFKGLVFSDDIFMAALAENGYPPERAALSAIEAGVDVIMISKKKFAREHALLVSRAKEDDAFAKRIEESARRVIDFKIERGILVLEKTGGVWHVVSAFASPYIDSAVQSGSAIRYDGEAGGEIGRARVEAFRTAKKENDELVAEVYSARQTRVSAAGSERNAKL